MGHKKKRKKRKTTTRPVMEEGICLRAGDFLCQENVNGIHETAEPVR